MDLASVQTTRHRIRRQDGRQRMEDRTPMIDKPTSGDSEQRRAQTRAAREQSGLPPEDEATAAETQSHGRGRTSGEPSREATPTDG